MYVNNVPKNSDTYINTLHQIASYILKLSSSFLSQFVTKHSYQFHIACEPTITTAFSSLILSNVFDQAFQISGEVQKNAFDFLSLVTRINYLKMYQIKNITTSPISIAPSQWSREVSARNVYAQTPKQIGTEVMSSWLHIIQYNNANR